MNKKKFVTSLALQIDIKFDCTILYCNRIYILKNTVYLDPNVWHTKQLYDSKGQFVFGYIYSGNDSEYQHL